jgi:hypothetical protein
MDAIGQDIDVTQFNGAPTKTFAVAFGCDVRHAGNQDRFVTGDADRQGLRAAGLSTARVPAGRPIAQSP